MTDQLESTLRACLAQFADEVPPHVAERLRAQAYRARKHRRRTVSILAVAALLISAGVGLLVTSVSPTAPSHSPAVGGSSWRLVGDLTQAWTSSTGAGYQPTLALTCPSASTCYAQAISRATPPRAEVEVTHNGGKTWHATFLPEGLGFVGSGIDCVSASTCLTILTPLTATSTAQRSPVLVETHDGGTTWTQAPFGAQVPVGLFQKILSCTTATSCVAVFGRTVMTTSNGGVTWTVASVLSGDFSPHHLECFHGGRCIMLGTGTGGIAADPAEQVNHAMALYSDDDGRTWMPATLSADVGALGSMSCVNQTECLALAYASTADAPASLGIVATTDGGKTWRLAGDGGLPVGATTSSISCVSSGTCWIAGWFATTGAHKVGITTTAPSLLAMSTNDGQTWHASQLSPADSSGAVTSVSCPDATLCYAIQVRAHARMMFLSYGK